MLNKPRFLRVKNTIDQLIRDEFGDDTPVRVVFDRVDGQLEVDVRGLPPITPGEPVQADSGAVDPEDGNSEGADDEREDAVDSE